MNFSNYRIYITDDGCAASLIEPNDDLHLLDERFLFSFESGIKKLQEEKRAMWLTHSLSKKKSISKYFEDTYGIYAV